MDIPPTGVMTRPGKAAMAVGQQAKIAVAEARAAGAELPKNAQGLAASGIARGAEPASIFAALVATPPDQPSEVPVDGPPPTDPGDVVSDPPADGADEADTIEDAQVPETGVITVDAESAALQLLEDASEERV